MMQTRQPQTDIFVEIFMCTIMYYNTLSNALHPYIAIFQIDIRQQCFQKPWDNVNLVIENFHNQAAAHPAQFTGYCT